MRGEVPRLPAVPHQLDVGVVALAGRLRAAGLLVGEVDGVVRLAEVVEAVLAGVGRGRAALVGLGRVGRAEGEGDAVAGGRELACGG
mgnify:CR=1 FL=1